MNALRRWLRNLLRDIQIYAGMPPRYWKQYHKDRKFARHLIRNLDLGDGPILPEK